VTSGLRFGLQISPGFGDDVVAQALRAQALGFDLVLVGDHIGAEPAPLPVLTAIAQGTDRIRLGTYVLNADHRNPVQLAWEAVTLDHLSAGRFELGLGAGHTPAEYAATGIRLQPAAVRKRRLMELVEVVRRLLDGETVHHRGEFFQVAGAEVGRSRQDRLPILVGGNGSRLLAHAARHADAIGLQGLGRTLPDGHRHEIRWSLEHLDRQVAHVRRAADGVRPPPAFSALVQVVEVTDDRTSALDALRARLPGLTDDAAGVIPYVFVGTVDQIRETVVRAAQRWGIRDFVVRDAEAFAPVIAAVRSAG